MKAVDVYPFLNKEELNQVTDVLLESCSRNGLKFEVFELILKVVNYD
tara:strand:- start:1185 stop:1325 length:141 start_codon:yes stop_codon:yes gene_type:complete